MIEKVCNIWDMYNKGEYVCITTNGYVKRNRRAVMGRGVASQAKGLVPGIDLLLGNAILENGNCVQKISRYVISFPVKPIAGQCHPDKSNVVPHMRHKFQPFDMVPGWAMMADMDIIERSMWQLMNLHDYGFFERVCLPKPGCGAGGLKWEDVEPFVAMYSQGGADWLVVCDWKG